MFFGTPHFGSDKTQLGRIAEAFSPLDRSRGGKGSKGNISPLVKAMKRNSDDLQEMEEDFREIAPKYKIISFFETRVWPGTKECIVDEMSARLVTYDVAVAVDADHVAMCQFEDDEDATFIEVCQRIQDAVGVDSDANNGLSDDDDSEVSDPEAEGVEAIPRSMGIESPVGFLMLGYTTPAPTTDPVTFFGTKRNDNGGLGYGQARDQVPAYSRIPATGTTTTTNGGLRPPPVGEQSERVFSRLFRKNVE